MKDSQNNLMIRYLLGDLPEPDQSAIEERCFTDNETFDLMWENENRLVDDYVRNKLTPADRRRFEEHYLSSPVHQRRVAIAHNLLAAAESAAGPSLAPETRRSFMHKLAHWLRLSPAWQFAMTAAMLLLIAGGIWLLVERARLRSEIAKLKLNNDLQQNREHWLAVQLSDEQKERLKLLTELDTLRKQQSSSSPSQGSTTQAVGKILTFALSPIGIRGGAGQSLTVPPDVARVQFQLTVSPGEWQSFQVDIQTVERKEVWNQRLLKPRADRMIIAVPAAKLPYNDYILTLSGVDRTGQLEEINRYAFRVIRR